MSRRALLRTRHRPATGTAGRALAATVAAAALLVGVDPVGAARAATPPRQAEPEDPAPPVEGGTDEGADRPLGELPELSAALADVELTSDGYDQVVARRDEVADQRAAAERREAEESATIVAATAREAELSEQIEAARARAERWEGVADRIDDAVRAVAVGSYMRGSSADIDPLFSLDPDAHDRAATASVTSESMARRQVRELERARSESRRARSEETLSIAMRDGVRDALAAARIARDEARADKERLAIELLEATAAIEDERRLATVVGAGFPLVVLDAYWKAAEAMQLLAPGCGIQWWALAGIGKIESRHGTYGGSEVRADGSLTKPIIGIPLTGAGGTAFIGDSDGGLIDGDPTVDRAAGPMQFIPQTWAAYGVDGDRNGRIEIQNIYDAAAGAARYLCVAAGSMADVGGLQRGYFAYNHSAAYVASVLSQAVHYGTAVPIAGVPAPPAAPPPPPPPAATEAPAATTTTTTAPPG
ncbi:MAG TPA: lytic transglycosylase domain-containing protein [Iamia sp.]|nr:lytic transglycosylase domain-containing protein [Iamia sp.]